MLKINCDGGARGNPGPAAAAFVVYDPSGEVIHSQGKFLGVATNNQAEYAAVEMAIDWLIKNPSAEEIEFYLDSMLVANQLAKKYKIKNLELKDKFLEIEKKILQHQINVQNYIYLPREKNFLADKIVNETLDQYNSA